MSESTVKTMAQLFDAMRQGDKDRAMTACGRLQHFLRIGHSMPTYTEMMESFCPVEPDERSPGVLLGEMAEDLAENSVEAMIERHKDATREPAICVEPDCWTVVKDVGKGGSKGLCPTCDRHSLYSMTALHQKMTNAEPAEE